MTRITMKQLDHLVDAINRCQGTPLESCSRVGNKFVSNIGNYHISSAYGGWRLEQMANEQGGIRDVFRLGYKSKRRLHELLQAFFEGLLTREGRSSG